MVLARAGWAFGIACILISCHRPQRPAAPAPVRADACAPASEYAEVWLRHVRKLVTAPDSQPSIDAKLRRQYELPRLEAATVTIVTDPAICSRAARAYTSSTNNYRDWPEENRRVHVIQAGNRYVVFDPFTPARAGEFHVWAIYTSEWRLVTHVFS